MGELITYSLVEAIKSQFGNLGEIEDWRSSSAYQQKIAKYDPLAGYLRFEAVVDMHTLSLALFGALSKDVDLAALGITSEYVLLDPQSRSWVNRIQSSSATHNGVIKPDETRIKYKSPAGETEYGAKSNNGDFDKVVVSVTHRNHVGKRLDPGPSATVELDRNLQKTLSLAGETKSDPSKTDLARQIAIERGEDPLISTIPWVNELMLVVDGSRNMAKVKPLKFNGYYSFYEDVEEFPFGRQITLPRTPYAILLKQRDGVCVLRRSNLVTNHFWDLKFFVANHLRAITDAMTGSRNEWSNIRSAFPIDLEIKP